MPDRLSFIVLRIFLSGLVASAAMSGCASLPDPKFKRYEFPKNAFVGEVQRPYSILGPVRSKVDYQTLDPGREESDLCRNYYNKAVRDLVKYAKKQGADAVVDVKSIVFLVDGRTESYATPECSDDGGEGQVLAQGVAVKWKGAPVGAGAWTQPPVSPRAAPAPTAPVSKPITPDAFSVLPPPSVTNPNAPVFPVGGTLVPDGSDRSERPETPETDAAVEPAAAAGSYSAPIAHSEPGTHPAPVPSEVPTAPVTVQMETYDPAKNLISSPTRTDSDGSRQPSGEQSPPAPLPPVSTAAQSAPTLVQPAPLPTAAPRLPFADPRAVPGSYQRSIP